MKRTLSAVLTAVMLFGLCSVSAFAAEASAETAQVYVTVSDSEVKYSFTVW